jgi:hypothetical protein
MPPESAAFTFNPPRKDVPGVMERRDPADEPRVGTEVRDGGGQLYQWKAEEALVGVAECEG